MMVLRSLGSVLCVLASVLFLSVSQASALVIDFNELAHDDFYHQVNPVTADGYFFSNSQGTPYGLGVWGRNSSFQADPGFAAVFVNYGYTTTTMTELGGGSFDFNSIDLADVYNTGVPSTIQFTFNYTGGGSVTQNVTLDGLVGLQTFLFNRVALDSVVWVTVANDNGWGQFDNVNVNTNVGPAVPEPSTILLLGAGLAGLGLLGRKRMKG